MAIRANGIDIGFVNGDAVLVERTLPVFAIGLVIHAVVGGDADADILSLVRLQGGFEFGEIGFGIRLRRAVVRRIMVMRASGSCWSRIRLEAGTFFGWRAESAMMSVKWLL